MSVSFAGEERQVLDVTVVRLPDLGSLILIPLPLTVVLVTTLTTFFRFFTE